VADAKKNYQYIARSQTGQKMQGSIQATTKLEVSQYLQQQGLVPISIDEVTPALSLNYLSKINVGGVPVKDKVFFMRQFATMISAGLPLTKALEILNLQATNPRFKEVLKGSLEDVSSGKALADSFAAYPDVFDTITINLVRAGEKSGKLEEIIKQLAAEYENRQKLGSKIQSAMVYPIIITVVMVAVVFLLMVFMVPTMAGIYEGFDADLPLVTQILITISSIMAKFWVVILVLAGVLVVGFMSYIRSGPGKQLWHRFLIKVPVFGQLVSKTQIANFSRILYLLTHSGMSILESLDLTAAALSNVWYHDAVIRARGEVEKGRPLALTFLQSDIFPMTVGYMINVGEETGELDNVLEKLASYYDLEVQTMTETLTAIIEPVMIVVMGVVIGFVAIAIYMPMFQLTQLIK